MKDQPDKKSVQLFNNETILSFLVANKEREPSPPPKVEKAVTKAKSKPVVGKDKGVKEKSLSQAQISEVRLSRPSSQNFEMTKAHWILRVVSDAGVGVSLIFLLLCFQENYKIFYQTWDLIKFQNSVLCSYIEYIKH